VKLSRVARVMTKRLAWLTAKADAVPANKAIAEERDALHTLLRCQGMLDEDQVAVDVARCEARVLPAEQRTKARAQRGDELVGVVQDFVGELHRALRSA
jgi:hypothetical protein